MKTSEIVTWLGVAPGVVSKWKSAGAPVEKKGDLTKWLKEQPLPARGRLPNWASVVKHPELKTRGKKPAKPAKARKVTAAKTEAVAA